MSESKEVPSIRVWKPEPGQTVSGVLVGSTSFEFRKGKLEKLAVLETEDGLVAIPQWYEFHETMKQQRALGKVEIRKSVIEIKYLGDKDIKAGTVAVVIIRLDGVVVASRSSRLETSEDGLPF
jgi:hypothetical protein